MIPLSCFISKHLSTALQLASFTLVSEVLQVDLWIWCPFFPHFSCQQCTDFRKSYFCAVTLFWLFIPRSPVVWVLLPPLAGKYLCCPHPPPSVGPSWPRVPWDLPVQPLLWLCCIKEMTWLKIKPLVLQISSSILVHHAASQKQTLTHFRGRWAQRGEGCWSCPSMEEISARLHMKISAQGMARLRNDLFLVIAVCRSLSWITSPAWFSSWPHKCYPSYFFWRCSSNFTSENQPASSLSLFMSHFKSTRDFRAPALCVGPSSNFENVPFYT